LIFHLKLGLDYSVREINPRALLPATPPPGRHAPYAELAADNGQVEARWYQRSPTVRSGKPVAQAFTDANHQSDIIGAAVTALFERNHAVGPRQIEASVLPGAMAAEKEKSL
jgi:hypothetical protein